MQLILVILTKVWKKLVDGCSSSTRGLFGGGYQPSLNNTIDYVEIKL